MVAVRYRKKPGTNQTINTMLLSLIFITAIFMLIVFIDGWHFRLKTVDPRMWFGIETIELTADVKKQYNLLSSNGIFVSRAFQGSPAQAFGLKEGDVIQRWNGISITSQEQFQYLIQTSEANDQITLTVDRQGKPVLVYGWVGIRPGGV